MNGEIERHTVAEPELGVDSGATGERSGLKEWVGDIARLAFRAGTDVRNDLTAPGRPQEIHLGYLAEARYLTSLSLRNRRPARPFLAPADVSIKVDAPRCVRR